MGREFLTRPFCFAAPCPPDTRLQTARVSCILYKVLRVEPSVGLTNLLSIQPETAVNRKRSAMDANRGTPHWRISVLLLLVSLFSVAGLAKRSFCLPRSSDCHWISQACKMREPRRTAAPRVIAHRAQVVVPRERPTLGSVRSVVETGQLYPETPGFFPNASLRAPPFFS